MTIQEINQGLTTGIVTTTVSSRGLPDRRWFLRQPGGLHHPERNRGLLRHLGPRFGFPRSPSPTSRSAMRWRSPGAPDSWFGNDFFPNPASPSVLRQPAAGGRGPRFRRCEPRGVGGGPRLRDGRVRQPGPRFAEWSINDGSGGPASMTGPMTPSALAWSRPAAPTASRPRPATPMATGKSSRGTAPTWCASVAPTHLPELLAAGQRGRWLLRQHPRLYRPRRRQLQPGRHDG